MVSPRSHRAQAARPRAIHNGRLRGPNVTGTVSGPRGPDGLLDGRCPAGARRAQDSMGAADACSLLTNIDVERITGSRLYGDPEPMALGGGSGCAYGGGAAQ